MGSHGSQEPPIVAAPHLSVVMARVTIDDMELMIGHAKRFLREGRSDERVMLAMVAGGASPEDAFLAVRAAAVLVGRKFVRKKRRRRSR
mgnify:CR=1 FL=1